MAEFNRTSLDIMDELYAPFKEAQAQKQGLERQAGGAALSRELQLRDAATKRDQQVLDAQTAHDRGLANIAKAAEEQARMQKEASEYRAAENLKEKRGQAITLREKLAKAGVHMGVSTKELQDARMGALTVHLKDLSSEYEIFKVSDKSSADIIEKLKSLYKHDAGREMIRGTLGLEPGDPIDWESLQDEPQPYLAEMLGDARSKHLLLKGKDSWVPRWNAISKQLHQAMTDVDLFSVASGENAEAQSDFSSWVVQDIKFKDELKGVIKADWDLNPFSSNEQLKYDGIISDLQAGNLDVVINKLRAEGEAASTPLIGAFTNWLAASEAKSAAAINAKIFNKQNAVSNLRSLLDARDKMLVNHSELDTLDDTHWMTNKDYDRLAERNRPDAPTPDALAPDADPGGLGSLYPNPQQNIQATPVAPLSDMESEIDSINNITPTVSPAAPSPAPVANPEVELSTSPFYRQPSLDRFDRDGDGKLGAYEKLLKADEEEGFVSGRAGMPEGLVASSGEVGGGTITADERSWGGKQLDKAGNYLFPRYMAGEQQASLVERYDPDADYWGLLNSYAPGDAPSDIRAGAGDVVLEFGGMLADAWLAAGGLNILSKAPAALSRVKALVSKPIVSGVGAFGRTAASRKAAMLTPQVSVQELAKALGGGAALESLKAFVKTPANIKEAVRRIRQSGMRYSPGAVPKPGAGAFGRTPGSLNFTPSTPESLGRMGLNYRPPIVPPTPTP